MPIRDPGPGSGRGFSPPAPQWPLHAFIVAEPAGFLLNQNAFQESSRIAPVLAIRTVTDPLVAIGIGLAWLALAYRSPHIAANSPVSVLKNQPRDGI
jgi:hypothetical protein